MGCEPDHGSPPSGEAALARGGVEPESGGTNVFHHDLLSLDDPVRVRLCGRAVNRRGTLGAT
jgi:hypothetical protein